MEPRKSKSRAGVSCVPCVSPSQCVGSAGWPCHQGVIMNACRLLNIHRLQCREGRRCVTELGGDFCPRLRHQRLKYPAASCVRWRCNGVFLVKSVPVLAPAVRKAVACSWDASWAVLRLLLVAKDSSAAHCVCQCRKSVFRNMKRLLSIRLNCFCASKVGEKSRFQTLRSWGEACFLSDVFGAWKDPPLNPVALSQR